MKKEIMIGLTTLLTAGGQLMASHEVKVKTLNNGFTVILNEDHRIPKVFGTVIVKAGGKDDPSDATGLAHYMEHMLFKGTTELGTSDWEKEAPLIEEIFQLYDQLRSTKDANERQAIQQKINEVSVEAGKYTILNEFSNLIYRVGGTNLNAFTSPDVTVFFNEFPPNQISRWIDLYSHRFQSPVFRAFQAELEVVYEEKNMYEDKFQTKLIETFNRHFFKVHPYGQRTLIGTTEDLKNPSLSRMFEFYKTHYVANNMALVLSGDFNSDEIMPLIEKTFGNLPSGENLIRRMPVEQPFNGREVVEVKLTPIRFNLMGYRTPTEKDPDKLVIEIIARMLNNNSHTGYLDQLTLDHKLLAAYAVPLTYHDYGAFMIVAVPKLLGQSFEDAEKLVKAQLKRLADGDFSTEFFETVKYNYYREELLKFESLQEKSLALAFAFAQGIDPKEVFKEKERIKHITAQDIQRITAKYFGENYLVLQSKVGSAPKDKIEKPNFKPIPTNTSAISSYQKHFLSIPADKYEYKPIDFNTDIQIEKLDENIEILTTKNPENDIFTLRIQFGVGTSKIPMLEYAVNYMNMCGLQDITLNDLKMEFAKLGTTYSFEVDQHFTTISLEGIEKNIPKSLALINKLINEPYPDDSKIKVLYESEKAGREVERQQPDDVAFALYQYALYGEKSKFLNRPSLKQIKRFKAKNLIDTFKEATRYSVKIFYTGQSDIQQFSTHVKNNLRFSNNLQASESPVFEQPIVYDGNQVFFVNKKKAAQAKIFIASKSDISPKEYTILEAFNVYFGGGFSGILIQEIREYRSMAYAVGGGFKLPRRPTHPSMFASYVGTQADKTIEALDMLDSLIRNLPQKPERMELIVDYLINRTISDKPHFRQLLQRYEDWRYMGYETDPIPSMISGYQKLNWDDLMNFYKKSLQNNQFIVVVAGDKERFDVKSLAKYGKVNEIKEKKLFVY
ncbi:MAG TPA: insulinase family protein [Salinivirgaceae bacterium]|nr:insulinase family protein [Salinivirgaceae bacterium]